MQIDNRAAGTHPLSCHRIIDLGVGSMFHISRQNRAVRQQGPAFLRVEIALTRGAEGSPLQSLWIEFSHLFCKFVSYHKLAIGDRKSTRLNSSHLGISY